MEPEEDGHADQGCTGLSRPVRIETRYPSLFPDILRCCTGLSRPVRIETAAARAPPERGRALHRSFKAGED